MNKVENMPEFKYLLKKLLTDMEYACYKGYHFENLTQYEVAIHLNISQSSVSNYLRTAENKVKPLLQFATSVVEKAEKKNKHKLQKNYDYDKKIVGQRLKDLRKNSRLTQRDVSKKLGVDIRVIAGIEKGTSNLKVSQLIQLANCYNSSVDEILFG